MKETCSDIRLWCDAYLDDELSSTDHRTVERHLASCTECHAFFEETRAVDEAVRAGSLHGEPDTEYFDDLPRRFQARFDLSAAEAGWRRTRRTTEHNPLAGVFSRLLRLPLVRVAALTVIVISLAFAVQRLGESPLAPELHRFQTDENALRPAVPPSSPPTEEQAEQGTGAPPGPSAGRGAGPEAGRPAEDGAPAGSRVDLPSDVDHKASSGESSNESAPAAARTTGTATTSPSTRSNKTAPVQTSPPPSDGPSESSSPESQAAREPGTPEAFASLEPAAEPSDSLLLLQEGEPSLPDSLWTAGWLSIARSKAVEALRAGDTEACRHALLRFWRASHRGGRDLAQSPEVRARLFQGDRAVLDSLRACAGR